MPTPTPLVKKLAPTLEAMGMASMAMGSTTPRYSSHDTDEHGIVHYSEVDNETWHILYKR